MSKQSRQRQAERLWCERFGQPPPIRTDAELMMKVLRSAGPAPMKQGIEPLA